VKTDINVAVL